MLVFVMRQDVPVALPRRAEAGQGFTLQLTQPSHEGGAGEKMLLVFPYDLRAVSVTAHNERIAPH